MVSKHLTRATLAATAAVILATSATAQEWTPLKRGSDNIEVLGHLRGHLFGPPRAGVVDRRPLGPDLVPLVGQDPEGGDRRRGGRRRCR